MTTPRDASVPSVPPSGEPRTDEAVRASEERYSAFIHNSSEGIWRLEFDPPIDTALPVDEQVDAAYRCGILAECNVVMARMYGFSSIDEIIGKGLDFMLPASDPGARAYVASIIAGGYQATEVASVERDNAGRPRHFANSMRGVIEDGRLRRMWGTQRDITAQKVAEQALRDSEERFRRLADERRSESAANAYLAAIVDSSDDAIISKDLNGIIRSVNAAAERIFGYSAAELIGQPVLMLIPPERQQEEAVILERVRRGQRVDHFETVRVAKDGRLVAVSLSVSAVRDNEGRIIGASKIARDISERDRLLAAERAARAEAERASRVKDDFVAMVSHELRTPLNAILGWTQLIAREQRDTALVARGLAVIERNTRLQAQLISDLLDISRIVAGKLRLEMERADLTAIVADAIETVRQEAESKGVSLVYELCTDPTFVTGDPARLQQVLWNLLSNALKFTASGGTARVALRRDGANVRIEVSDNGVGIRADFLPHVFDRFHQADRSITRRFGGLGLGLAIVKHLVELHGGTVEAASDGPAHGSTFTVTLPASTAVATSAPTPREPGSPVTRTAASLDAARILVVEDEPDTLQFLQRLLEGHGAIVRVAASAAEALEAVRAERPDVMVSDIGLPDVDGYDLMQQVRRADVHLRRMPAIALTAYAREEDRLRALAAGFNAHIPKPVESAELVDAIARFIRPPATEAAR